jgi:hypothetical protein
MPELPATIEWGRIIAGCSGAAAGVLLMPQDATWRGKLTQFVSGGLLSYFATGDLVRMSGMSPGLAGFLCGALGMAVVAKVFDLVKSFELGTIVTDWLRKILGLPPKV